MATKYIVNDLTGQTINGESILPKYKVFTALVTQIGEDDVQSFSENGDPLTIGMTYFIEDNGGSGWDFTNIGAPNNNIGTYFIATGTVPNSWGINGFLVGNNGAPKATVLENTIGDIWFTYMGTGYYFIGSNGLFTINKTWGFSASVFAGNTGIIEPVSIDISGVDGSELPSTIGMRLTGGDFGGDDLLKKTPIEIRVYN